MKKQWRRTLESRWRKSIGGIKMRRIVWLSKLSPDEYLALLAVGDLMIDPYPFGGGVTVLESLSVCTPVLTAPSLQSVPSLAAGIIRAMHLGPELESLLVARSVHSYVSSAVELLGGDNFALSPLLLTLRQSTCSIVAQTGVVFNQSSSVREWESFITRVVSIKQSF